MQSTHSTSRRGPRGARRGVRRDARLQGRGRRGRAARSAGGGSRRATSSGTTSSRSRRSQRCARSRQRCRGSAPTSSRRPSREHHARWFRSGAINSRRVARRAARRAGCTGRTSSRSPSFAGWQCFLSDRPRHRRGVATSRLRLQSPTAATAGGEDRGTLTIQQSPTPIVKKQTIDIINPGRDEDGRFRTSRRSTSASGDHAGRRRPGPGREEGQQLRRVSVIFSLGRGLSAELIVAIAAASAPRSHSRLLLLWVRVGDCGTRSGASRRRPLRHRRLRVRCRD